MECRWIRTSQVNLARLRKASGGVAVLPLSSIESHGPHAPTGSDPLCLEHLLGLIEKQETVAILPQLPYSHVPDATRLPGAVHIDSDILIPLVENICDELHRNGFSKIVLLHGHGGNVPLHAMFAHRMLEKCKRYAVYSIQPLPGMHDFYMGLMESKDTGHACEMETSMNLVACPECVDLKKVKGRRFRAQPHPAVGEALTPVEWTSRWPTMAVGEPGRATRQKGEKILNEWARRVVGILRKIKKDKIVPRVMSQFARERQSHRR